MMTIDPEIGDALRRDLVTAMQAEQCAFAFPYLSPSYMPTNPTSERLKKSKEDASQAGLDSIVKAVEKQWATGESKLGHCPETELESCKAVRAPQAIGVITSGEAIIPEGCIDSAFRRFSGAVSAYNKSLDTALATLTIYPALRTEISARLVKDFVQARWGLENANEFTCSDADQKQIWEQEKRRHEALRRHLEVSGHTRELNAANQQWAIEEVREYRRPGDRSYVVCTLDDAHDYHDEIELLLADTAKMRPPPPPPGLAEDLKLAAISERCILDTGGGEDNREVIARRRFDIIEKWFMRWGWTSLAPSLAVRRKERPIDDCDLKRIEVANMDRILDGVETALLGKPARLSARTYVD